ncbi:MAG: hypothetical protein LBN74_08250 [Prevotella sp.]|jgi:hypothetical protein|nr:hypothetical protein [Prevotella sp.]
MNIRQVDKKLLIKGLESFPLVNYEPASLKEWPTGWQIEYRVLILAYVNYGIALPTHSFA